MPLSLLTHTRNTLTVNVPRCRCLAVLFCRLVVGRRHWCFLINCLNRVPKFNVQQLLFSVNCHKNSFANCGRYCKKKCKKRFGNEVRQGLRIRLRRRLRKRLRKRLRRRLRKRLRKILQKRLRNWTDSWTADLTALNTALYRASRLILLSYLEAVFSRSPCTSLFYALKFDTVINIRARQATFHAFFSFY